MRRPDVVHLAEQDDDERSWRAEWEAALTLLDLDLDAAEALLAASRGGPTAGAVEALGSWTPPAGLGRLPESLQERAEAVLARQLRVIEDVAQAAVRSRQQLELSRRMAPSQPTPPLFVDAAV
ncbi:hypothetical protein [Angustibacter sp. Root456]|uniref:hypothetical protein n=1 Tax=Angustibacter sp. Root456 TaxID=1736539 RepID=UPI0006F9CE9F|nr:hypothetical protein [Angustibacter sp. Root456]